MAHRNFARAMRRKTQWVGMGNAAGAAVLPVEVDLTAGTAALLSQAFVRDGQVGLEEEEATITRTIGSVQSHITAGTANLSATVAVGCGIARGEAIAAGVGSLPSPEDDPDFEWLFYGVYLLHNASSGQQDDSGHQVVNFDVRGQRIVRGGSNVFWVAESQNADCSVGVGGRYLVKLP